MHSNQQSIGSLAVSNTSTKEAGNTCFANLSSVREEHFHPHLQFQHQGILHEAPFSTKSSLREAKPPIDYRQSSYISFSFLLFLEFLLPAISKKLVI